MLCLFWQRVSVLTRDHHHSHSFILPTSSSKPAWWYIYISCLVTYQNTQFLDPVRLSVNRLFKTITMTYSRLTSKYKIKISSRNCSWIKTEGASVNIEFGLTFLLYKKYCPPLVNQHKNHHRLHLLFILYELVYKTSVTFRINQLFVYISNSERIVFLYNLKMAHIQNRNL